MKEKEEKWLLMDNCGPCNEVMGRVFPAGGTIFENENWLVNHRRGKYTIPGHLIIKLKRQCEHLAELTSEEADSLGLVIQKTCLSVSRVIKPEKVHVASYGEGVKHIHFFVTPRTKDMPAGNCAAFIYIKLNMLLQRLGIIRAYTDKDRAEMVHKIQEEFDKIR